MERQSKVYQLKRWKFITVWLLAVMLAVTMAAPAASFAAKKTEDNSAKAGKAKVTRSSDQADKGKNVKSAKKPKKSNKKNKKSDKDKKSKKNKNKKDKSKKNKKGKKQNKKSRQNKKANKKAKSKARKKVYRSTYRARIKKNGTARCWWYGKNGKKNGAQKNGYFFITLDNGSKTRGTAVKKARDKGLLYYFDDKGRGKAYTGWFSQDGRKYYFRNAKRLRGWEPIKKTRTVRKLVKSKKNKKNKKKKYKKVKKTRNTWYAFSHDNGQVLRKIGDDADRKVQPYYSNTSYMVIVNCKKHQTRIYSGSANNWKRIHKWKCTTGKPSTPTIKGTFSIGVKGLHFDTGSNMRVWYYTQFCGNYFFHSVLYDRQPKPVRCVSGWLGISRSHGCIRLKLENSKWIYDHVPAGTKVVIY